MADHAQFILFMQVEIGMSEPVASLVPSDCTCEPTGGMAERANEIPEFGWWISTE
jgi:hypothetical protein